jgi:hypothetical protein
MDLTIRTQTVGDTPVWLDSTETLRFRPGGITIDPATVPLVGGKRVITSGTAVGVMAGGLGGPCDDTAVDGRQNPIGHIWETLDVTAGAKIGSVMDHGRVREARLPVAVTATQKPKLNALGVSYR